MPPVSTRWMGFCLKGKADPATVNAPYGQKPGTSLRTYSSRRLTSKTGFQFVLFTEATAAIVKISAKGVRGHIYLCLSVLCHSPLPCSSSPSVR